MPGPLVSACDEPRRILAARQVAIILAGTGLPPAVPVKARREAEHARGFVVELDCSPTTPETAVLARSTLLLGPGFLEHLRVTSQIGNP